MYAAPPSVEARVFARIPERFHRKNARSDWTNTQFHGNDAPTFLEGPSFDRDGNLYVVDIPWGRIFKIDPKGEVSVAAEYDGEPNGLKFHRDGRAFIADYKNGIMVLDPKTGKVEPLLERAYLARFRGVNDLVFASNGDLFFTDQGQSGLHDPTGRLYRLSAGGLLTCMLDNIPSPNGLVLNAAENIVFLAVTRDNAIWRVPFREDGSVYKVGAFIRMSGGTGPDGMAIDRDGNIVVCHVGMGSVWLFDALGEPMLRIRAPGGLATTNCAYGGPDNRQLFITESSTSAILVADMPVAGRPMYSHA